MRIKIVGSEKFANVTFECDCLRSTTVMMIKVNINKQLRIPPSEQQLTYKGIELNNMECILNCGIQPGEFIELTPAQHLITATLVYGKETVKVDIKQTTTISSLKNLLFTKMHKPVNMNTLVAIFDGSIVKDTSLVSTLELVSRHPIYFTYVEMKFHIHVANGDMHSVALKYNQTVGDLRQLVSGLCKEDPNLLVLEMGDEAITEEDSVPLYKTAFLDTNRVCVIFESIGELMRRVRLLEQKHRQQDVSQEKNNQNLCRCKDLMQRNEVTLRQMRISLEATRAKQEQQVDTLSATMKMLEGRLKTLTPRFDELSEIRAKNEMLSQRLQEITKQHSRDSLSSATESMLQSLQTRVESLEKRMMRVSSPVVSSVSSPSCVVHSGRLHSPVDNPVVSSSSVVNRGISPSPVANHVVPPSSTGNPGMPPPVPLSALQQLATEVSKDPMPKEDSHFMPRLRRAFATPKLPSFVLKAVLNRPKDNTELICTLPPYSHM